MKTVLGAGGVWVMLLAIPILGMAEPAAPARTRLQGFIEGARCYASLPRHSHRPDFKFVRVDEAKYREQYSWILDGGQKIGLLNLERGEVEMFRAFPPAGGVLVEYKMPEVQHWATLQGPRICIVPQGSWNEWGKQSDLEYLQDKGTELRLRYTGIRNDRTRMTHGLNLRFDVLLGYVWDCSIDVRLAVPQRFEYANLLTGGLAESRQERKRYQKCIWTRRDGTICYMYQNPLSLMQWAGEEWTDMPADNGFVGWVAERDLNPFLEIVRSTPRTVFATCSEWYDQHVISVPPRRPDADGFYRITADYRMLSLPLPVAKELEDAARTMLPAPENRAVVGFRQGIVNDFETFIPSGTLYVGCMWGRGVRRVENEGHSGQCSLQVYGGGVAEPIHGGTPIYVETAKRYRLSAWVRTRGVTGGRGAYLRVNDVFWSWTDVRATRRSAALTGDTDWTLLSVEFKPSAGDPFAVPGLVVDGAGTAWFDDLELIELAD